MRTFHGVRRFDNIVHNAEPVDLHDPWAFFFNTPAYLTLTKDRILSC
jgi:hypothetical protein